ncbi:MAG: RdgB/HAM1 family non-canonical purine NTP pyrophosphatase, partial [Candidatus Binatia bacterium]|nr:RdgB/HAM1 family non-canonical purine NTP pyrophosphatase [Candidatus Binatia bacterium]
MGEIVLASRNRGKIREIQEFLKHLKLNVLSLHDFPDLPELPEEGETYQENAYQKACLAAEWTRKAALADDSGLEVEALGGAPGVRSARFLGEKTPQEWKNRRLLKLLEGVPPEGRGARFVCVLAIVTPEGSKFLCEGVCSGRVAHDMRGEGGFGYDPIFFLPSYRATMAELDIFPKNRISHRG